MWKELGLNPGGQALPTTALTSTMAPSCCRVSSGGLKCHFGKGLKRFLKYLNG